MEEFPEAGLKVWCPDGWHRGESRARGSFTGSLSVEDFEKERFFVTGFTVQAFHNLGERSRIPPSTFAESMAREIRASGYNKVLDWKPFVSSAQSGFRTASVRYRNAPPGGRKITVQKFIVAIDEVDRLVIVTFESPDESWERYFAEAGRPMLENLMFVLPGIAK